MALHVYDNHFLSEWFMWMWHLWIFQGTNRNTDTLSSSSAACFSIQTVSGSGANSQVSTGILTLPALSSFWKPLSGFLSSVAPSSTVAYSGYAEGSAISFTSDSRQRSFLFADNKFDCVSSDNTAHLQLMSVNSSNPLDIGDFVAY